MQLPLGSGEGSGRFGSIVRSLSLHFCKRLFPGLEPVTTTLPLCQGFPSYICNNTQRNFMYKQKRENLCSHGFQRRQQVSLQTATQCTEVVKSEVMLMFLYRQNLTWSSHGETLTVQHENLTSLQILQVHINQQTWA